MLEFNLGDLAARIVRALGVRGRVPIAGDETVVFTNQLTDLTSPIYANDPVECVFSTLLNGVAGNPVAIRIQNIRDKSRTMIRRVVVANNGAAPLLVQMYVVRGRAAEVSILPGIQLNAQQGINGKPALPAQTAADAAGTGVPATNVIYANMFVPVGSTVILDDMRAVLYAQTPQSPNGTGDEFWIQIPTGVANTGYITTFWQETTQP